MTLKNNYQVISERNELSEIPVMNRIDFVKSSAKRRDERRDSLSLHRREKSDEKGFIACTIY